METGQHYHVFNHSNGFEDIFNEARNYHYFMMRLLFKTGSCVRLPAFCLMPNHFHLACGIPELDKLRERDPSFGLLDEAAACRQISQRLSNALNSYTQSFNHTYGRMGSLFRQNTRWKMVEDEAGLCALIHYIHANPVHHGFVRRMEDWPYSSYSIYRSMSAAEARKNPIIQLFGGMDGFIRYHEQEILLKIPDVSKERKLLGMEFKKVRARRSNDSDSAQHA
jgi:REP element-mobilizing transposase RayT